MTTHLPANDGALTDRPGAPSLLVSALVRRGRQGFSGTLRVDGVPGGTVVMRDGLVVAATTPAAPGPEPLLLKSGRMSEADWSAAFTAGAPDGRLATELLDRGLLGSVSLEAVMRTAMVDAVFAMALSGVSTCTAEPASDDDPPPLLPVEPGLEPGWLVRETTRRLALAEGWRGAPGLTVRSRPVASDDPPRRPVLPERREVLDRVNGRRTARDIAFALGRGLFPTMTVLATLAGDGLIALPDPESVRPGPPPAPAPDDGLPRRQPGTSKINEVLPWPGDAPA